MFSFYYIFCTRCLLFKLMLELVPVTLVPFLRFLEVDIIDYWIVNLFSLPKLCKSVHHTFTSETYLKKREEKQV